MKIDSKSTLHTYTENKNRSRNTILYIFLSYDPLAQYILFVLWISERPRSYIRFIFWIPLILHFFTFDPKKLDARNDYPLCM